VGRRVDVAELVGAAEIADRLGLAHPEAVHNWRRRHQDFPEPVTRLRQAMIWYWPDVEKWARQTGRLYQDRG
jgi:transposase-like protein